MSVVAQLFGLAGMVFNLSSYQMKEQKIRAAQLIVAGRLKGFIA